MKKGNVKVDKKSLAEVLVYVLIITGMTFLYLVPKNEGFRFLTYIIVMMYAVRKFDSWLFEDDTL